MGGSESGIRKRARSQPLFLVLGISPVSPPRIQPCPLGREHHPPAPCPTPGRGRQFPRLWDM